MSVARTIFLFLCTTLIIFNACQLIQTLTPDRPVRFAGIKFSGLENILKQETHVGYITDLNLKETAPLAEYEQAQYVLAPTILDVNNPDHRFLIVNCSSDASAFSKLKDIGARPLTRNNFGVILAMRDQKISDKNLSTNTHAP